MAVVAGLLIPWLIFTVTEKIYLLQKDKNGNVLPEESTPETEPVFQDMDDCILVLDSDGTIEKMELDTYLLGVLLGEMPVEFEIEALKAQAVVARTYALKRSTSGQKHTRGAVCKESSCCQAYRSPEDFINEGGTNASLDKVSSAVNSTSGQVLYYNGALIEATFFSCSGGKTEDAMAVWGSDIHYLIAVDSPGEEGATYYTDLVRLSTQEFAELLELEPEGKPVNWFGSISYTAGGGVNTIQILGKTYKGLYLREKLGLRSTAFTISVMGDEIYIITKGFGHRVGMSQYGAEAMAVKGCGYAEILTHYYPGTELTKYTAN